ncbi:MAG: hypothetical protein M1838_002731 [Thelocarpon superellum]|nr:MAG: hypothetical protein M1838_002731 [Thelocarpon superellum]
MGRGMCKNLVEKGDLSKPLIIFNRTAKRAQDLSAKLPSGTSRISTDMVKAVTESDIIFTCVGADQDILEVLDIISRGCSMVKKLFVDCSTVHPDTTTKVAKIIDGHGAAFVACPGNTLILSMVEALSEGHVVAEKSGLGVENLQKFVDALFGGPYSAYSKRLSSGDYYKREEPLFAVDLARKDAGHALKIARDAGAQMKAVEVADAHLAQVKEHAGEKGDIAGIYGAVRKESGLNYEN